MALPSPAKTDPLASLRADIKAGKIKAPQTPAKPAAHKPLLDPKTPPEGRITRAEKVLTFLASKLSEAERAELQKVLAKA